MNIRSVKIALIPDEYCALVNKSQQNREAFLNIETLKTILSPSEVEFYIALNSLGVSFGDKAVLYPNVVNSPKTYEFPDSTTYISKKESGDIAARVKDRLMDVFKWTDRHGSNRQFLLDNLAKGIIPSSEVNLSLAYVDPTCAFFTFTFYREDKKQRMANNLQTVYEALHKCNLFELSSSVKEATIKTQYSYDNSMRSWHYFCGTILNMLVACDVK